MIKITWDEVVNEVSELCKCLESVCNDQPPELLWPIPRGGLFIAGLMTEKYPRRFRIASNVHEATLLIDDIICSGATARILTKLYNLPLVALHWRQGSQYEPIVKMRILDTEEYMIYPWEQPTETEILKEMKERNLV